MADNIPPKDQNDRSKTSEQATDQTARAALSEQFSKPVSSNVSGTELPNTEAKSTSPVKQEAPASSVPPDAKPPAQPKLPKIDIDNNPSGDSAPKTPAERRAAEQVYFQYLFEKKNMLLDPFQKGEGPEQVLLRMNESGKLGKNPWSVEQIHEEALRISRRDLTNGKDSYHVDEQTSFWSAEEIPDLVKQAVDRVKGIDVSHFDLDINWKEVKASGVDFAFLKATGSKRDGSTVVDEKFEQNRQGARDAGVAIGYYHFFRPDVPMDQQIDLFAKTVGKVERNSLPLVMDVEEDEKKPMWEKAADGHTYSVQERLKIIDEFCNGVKKMLGKDTPIAIYTSPKFVREFLANDPSLAKYELWDASWKRPKPVLPTPWRKASFWQYAGDNGKVAGIHKPDGEGVDLDMIMDPKIARMIKKVQH